MAKFLETKGQPRSQNKMREGNRIDQQSLPPNPRTKANIDPKVREFAESHGINWTTIKPSGKKNTVTMDDVQAELKTRDASHES